MKNFKGVIIEESLENKNILQKVKIIKTKVEKVTESHKTPWITKWTMHTIEILEDKSEEIAEILSKSLDSEHNWYADYTNDEFHYIIFRNKKFKIERSHPSQYQAITEYGVSLGIPEYQVDFSPHIKEWNKVNNNNINTASHSIQIIVDGTPSEFWQYFEPIDLSSIFEKTKFLPAVKKSSPVERWDTPGQKRTVYLESGDTAQEKIIECSKPNFFKYKVHNFTFALKYICKYAIGEWFIYKEKDNTTVEWTYTFYPKDTLLCSFILKLFVKNVWKEYMELSMKNLKKGYTKFRNLKNSNS